LYFLAAAEASDQGSSFRILGAQLVFWVKFCLMVYEKSNHFSVKRHNPIKSILYRLIDLSQEKSYTNIIKKSKPSAAATWPAPEHLGTSGWIFSVFMCNLVLNKIV
jgi:hypothetical protein